MLKRTVTVLSIFLLLSATMGCALFRTIDNSSPEDLRKFRASKDELWDRAKALENDKAACQKQLSDRQTEISLIQKGLSDQKDTATQTDRHLSELTQSINDLSAQLMQPREVGHKASPPPQVTGQARQSLKIKVLYGDGKKVSAAGMAKKLRGLGYRVAKIDRAPRSDFRVHTIYYKPGSRPDAVSLAKKLGGGAVSRPLSWPSVFDMIIVTGRRP